MEVSMQFDLVFEGGGAKGNVFVGALQAFEAAGHRARRYLGTSAGAITATMLAAGCDAAGMLEIVNERLPDGRPRFASFMDAPRGFSDRDVESSLTWQLFEKVDLPWIPGMAAHYIDRRIIDGLMELPAYRVIFSFIERGGLYEGHAFLFWLQEKLDAQQPGLGDATLAQFHEITGSDLSVVASDTFAHDMLILNHRTAPDCPVARAVRMSMSIPFLWQEVKWEADWGSYRGKDITGHTVVDGGVLSNFPIRLLETRDPDVEAIMGDTDPAGAETLGMLIDETLAVPGAPKRPDDEGANQVLERVEDLRTVRRAMRLVDTMTEAHDRLAVAQYPEKVCHLPAKGYGTTEFDMTPQRLTALIQAGKVAMEQHLAQG
jgi:NTE family protein